MSTNQKQGPKNICTDKIRWQSDCISKLAWYEENDKRLKVKECAE